MNPALFSKAAQNISSKIPTATDPCGLIQYGLPSAIDEGQYVGKVDYQMGTKHSVFARYIATKQFTPPPFSLDAAQQNLLVTRIGGRDNLAQTFSAGENFIISSTTFNQVRFAYNRTDINRTSTDFFSAPEVGINIYSYMPHYMLLTVGAAGANPTGFQLGGGTESLSTFTTPSWQVSDDVTLVRGPHQFAFGVNVAGWSSLSLANVRSPGQLAIDGTQTGLPLSDFLLGRMGVNALVQAAPNTLDMTQKYLGLYVQDTWRVGSKITLNVGLRYEPFFPQQLVNGAVYQFDKTRFDQNIHSVVFPKAPAGLYFPGDAGFPSQAGMNTQWGNLGPRVGIAWDPAGDGRTSVRASYGRSFEFVNAQFHLNTSVAPPWGSEVRINSPLGGLDNPFVNTQGQTNIFPVTFDQNAPFSLNGPFLSLSNDMAATHVDQWNVAVERQLTSTWFASVGYLGSRTNNIWESTPLNNAVFQNVGAAPPSAANINARRPFTLQDREERAVLRAGRHVCHRWVPELQRHAALCQEERGALDVQRQLHAVALLRITGRLRRRHDERLVGLQHPGQSRVRQRQLHSRPPPELHHDRQRHVRAVQWLEEHRVQLAASGQLQGVDRPVAHDYHRRRCGAEWSGRARNARTRCPTTSTPTRP